MFKALFRQNKGVDIDRLIFDIAEYKRTEDYTAFCKLIAERLFFVRVDPISTQELPRGVTYKIKPTDNVKAGLANIQDLKLLALFTSSDDKRLQGSYAEIEGLEALRMATKSAGIDGVLFQNNSHSWLVFKTDQIQQILDAHDEDKR